MRLANSACTLLLVLFTAFGVISSRAGTDCNCAKTGPFVSPDHGVSIATSRDTLSPHNKYRLTVTGTGPFNLEITRTSDNGHVWSTSLSGGYWGFSPDDDRFVYHYNEFDISLNTIHHVDLVDLTANPVVSKPLSSVSTTTSSIQFSAYGNYLMYAAVSLSAAHTLLSVFDAKSGLLAYNSEFDFKPVADTTDAQGMVDWGFSPDSASRTLVYAFVSLDAGVQWNVQNLRSHTPIRNQSLLNISSFWQFSPCGDVMGIVEQLFPTIIDVHLFKTISNQPDLYSQSLTLADPVEFRTTASSHIVNVGGTDYVMSGNTGIGICSIQPISLTLFPKSLVGGSTSSGTVVISDTAGAGGNIVILTSSNTAAATVPPTITVQDGQISAPFTVQTSTVGSVQSAIISATEGGVTLLDTLTVTPISLSLFTISSKGAMGGDSLNATVYLNAAAGTGGKVVSLSSGNSALATVPASVLVPQGVNSKSFSIHTLPVTMIDSVLLGASAGGVTISHMLRVLAFPTLSISEDTVVGGNPAEIIAEVAAPDPSTTISIVLSSSIDSIAHPISPGFIFSGRTQGILTVNTSGVANDVGITITATNAPFPTTASFHVVPANLSSFSADNSSGCVAAEQAGTSRKFIAGKPINILVGLDGEAPPKGAHPRLSSNKPSVLTIPDSADIPFHHKNNDPAVSALSDSSITAPEEVIISAAYRAITLYDTITIVPAPRFSFVDLGEVTDTSSRAVAINNTGTILGVSTVNYVDHAFLWKNGTRAYLPNPSGYVYPDVRGLNDSDVVVGAAYRDSGSYFLHGVVWKKDTTLILSELPGYAQSMATAINFRGDVVGVSDVPGIGVPRQPRATLWHEGTVTDLGTLPNDLYAVASDINALGEITGSSYRVSPHDYFPPSSSFFWQDSQVSTVNFGSNVANALNDSGDIAGNYTDQSGWFKYSTLNDENADFDNLPPFYETEVKDINNLGSVVGTVAMYDDADPAAFIYTSGFLYDLNCLTSLPGGYVLRSALSINDAGQIVGTASVTTGQKTIEHAYLLNPQSVLTYARENGTKAKLVPTAYALYQNYPNPFNPTTRIRYELSDRSMVTLKVYNVLGQVVETIRDDIEEAGYREVQLNAVGQSSGVYFYRLEARSVRGESRYFVKVMKMLQIK